MKKINLFFTAILFAGLINAQTIADFETLPLGADTFWNGSDLSGGFSNGNAFFVNSYNPQYSSWSGFAYTNKLDTTTAADQYAAIAGRGYNGSNNYAVGNYYGDAKIRLVNGAAGKPVTGLYVTNATYAYLSMQNGDQFAKKFGGVSGNDPDWFRLTIKGYSGGSVVADSVDFYLADFRFVDNSKDYLVKDWRWVDLRGLGNVDSVQFFLASSDVGQYGMNTPAYFAIDAFATGAVDKALPLVKNDTFTISYQHDTLLNVLGNDFDTSAMPLIITHVSDPLIPGATITPGKWSILYTPALGISSTDTLVYRLCDTAQNCNEATVIIRIPSNTAVNEVVEMAAQTFPNPFTTSFSIYHQAGVEQISLYDLQGREVKHLPVDRNAVKTDINAAGIPSGMYFVQLSSVLGNSLTRVVKQ